MCLSLDQFADSNMIGMRGTDNTVEFKGLGFEDLASLMRLKMGIFGGLLCTQWWKFCFCVFYTSDASSQFRVIAFFYGASRSHSDLPHSVGLLWTSDQHGAKTSTWQHTQETNNHAPGVFDPTISGSEPPQTHTFDRTVTFFPHSAEILVTRRGPSFPYRLYSMLLDNNGQRLGFL